MMDFSKFRYFASAYERPTFRYKCGRMAAWGKPCARGPNINGTCGGVTECSPLYRDGRYYCRRPKRAGGDCFDGPLPDGACSQVHPPCAPRRTLRVWRGRIAMIAAFVIIALIALSLASPQGSITSLAFVNPGPLSSHHANLSIDGGVACSACHKAADADAGDWLAAITRHADMTGQCSDCHGFAGPVDAPHNSTLFVQTRPEIQPTECRSCHKEHRGSEADISKLTDAQCNTCHLTRFDSFAESHDEFVKPFPYRRRNNILFDHATHLGKHFSDPKVSGNAPADCAGCHATDRAARYVPVVNYEKTCASCHDDQIRGREMAILRFPEFDQNYLEAGDIEAVCGPSEVTVEQMREKLAAFESGEEPEKPEEEEYYAYSLEPAALIGSYLTGIEIDDVEAQSEPLQRLFLAMAAEGQGPLAEMIAERSSPEQAAALLAGLNGELAKRLACQWAYNTGYIPPDGPENQGWSADEFTLLYKPIGHADPVMKAWMEFAVAAPAAADGADAERAGDMLDMFADRRRGPGACSKCHALSDLSGEAEEETLAFKWQYYRDERRSQKFFDHRPHLELSGPESACETCHVLNPEADYASSFDGHDESMFISNFHSVEKQTCASCHNETGVRQDCTLCHRYHEGPVFNRSVTRFMIAPREEEKDGS
jgi:hypothetical protein